MDTEGASWTFLQNGLFIPMSPGELRGFGQVPVASVSRLPFAPWAAWPRNPSPLRAALAELLTYAAASPEVRTVRASISRENVASLARARSCGLRQIGEQWDDEGGLELVFERAARG